MLSFGYVKERLIRHLGRQALGRDASRRLQKVVLAALERPARRELRAFCRLAVHVADDELRAKIAAPAKCEDLDVAPRATWMRDAILEGHVSDLARLRPPARG